MITTLTPNPSIDKSLTTDRFDVHKINRVNVLRTDFGGKGVNVSSALKNLGVSTFCTGISFAEDESVLRMAMTERNIPYEFITVPGKCRTCYKIFDSSMQDTIDINEYGPQVPPDTEQRLLELLARKAAESSAVTLCGSLPKGLDDGFYRRCVLAVRQANPRCRIVVDAEKKLLLNALEAHPNVLKPNINEFQDTFGCVISSDDDLDHYARKVVRDYGIEILCVSLGSQGAYITNGAEAWKCRPVRVQVRSVQGAGDSVVAGICAALEAGKPLPEILRYGVAAAGDSISKDGTQFCTREGVEPLLKQDIQLLKIG